MATSPINDNPFSSSESIEIHPNLTITPVNELTECKRNTFDSGYQEEEALDEQLAKPKEEWNTERVSVNVLD